MQLLYGLHNRSCTDTYLADHSVHNSLQTTTLCILLAYVIILNGTLVTFVLFSKTMMKCNLNKQLTSSFCGNIIGACSLYINEIVYSRNGIAPVGCELGVDKFYFLYLGVSWNVIVTVLNTFYRYNAIVSLKAYAKRKEAAATSSRQKYFVRCWWSAAIISLVSAGAASVLQDFFLSYQFLISSVFICFIPLCAVIVWNIRLTKYLVAIRQNAKLTGSESSEHNIERATFIIKVTIITHGTILMFGSGLTISAIFVEDNVLFLVSIIWFLRIGYGVLFSVEAGLFLYKTPCARKSMAKKLYAKFPCFAPRRQNASREDKEHTMTSLVASTSEKTEIIAN